MAYVMDCWLCEEVALLRVFVGSLILSEADVETVLVEVGVDFSLLLLGTLLLSWLRVEIGATEVYVASMHGDSCGINVHTASFA